MERKNVLLKNLTSSRLVIKLPDLHYSRTFERKGVTKPMPYDVLQEAIWDNGFRSMLNNGFIEILDDKICEEFKIVKAKDTKQFAEAKQDYNNDAVILVLDDNQKKRYLTVAPIYELRDVLTKLTSEQRKELANFAITNKLIDYERKELIKQFTGIDVSKEIEFRASMES